MGYQTDFRGELEFDAPLTAEQVSRLQSFNEERHGEFDHNGFPHYYCQWTVNDEGTHLFWDGGEKFYSYVEWLEYLIKKFIKPWGRTLNGTIEWRGEEWDDSGLIVVEDNKVERFEKK